jgi:flagellum-specific ATP synthase
MRHAFLEAVSEAELVVKSGQVRRIHATYIEADGPNLPLGSICDVESRSGAPTLAQVIGVNPDHIVLAPFEDSSAIPFGARVRARMEADQAPVGDVFLGRAVDALGRPIDGEGPIRTTRRASLGGDRVAPLSRISPTGPLETGVRAIDGLLTLGVGQRVGIFAAAGVGKTSLLAQLARQTAADRLVICLVGERGREVEALWNQGIGRDVRARSVMVAATSDQSAALRVRACHYALALAEHWRAAGQSVVLLLDSVTRLAMAMREIGLAAGEPPTVRAYTPGVFSAIPKVVERCGALKSGGAITAIMTVLSETDDVDDPISEMMKSLLDGHIVLSRSLAEQSHFPAIDVTASVSRLAHDLMTPDHRRSAEWAMEGLSLYQASRTLIETGIYSRGSNPALDRALDQRPALTAFLRQPQTEHNAFADTVRRLGGDIRRGA